MSQVSDSLSPESLAQLKRAFDVRELEDLYETVMGGRYERTLPYVQMVRTRFHDNQPPDSETTRDRISEEDRERCIIAILASRGAVRNLALHIYAALMLGIKAEEIADVIFLAGVYSGVPAVANGLDTQIKVLKKLEQLATDRDYRMKFAEESPGRQPELPGLGVTTVFKMLSFELQL
jgi:alkylhydroperoxidase/carboxymuconolactone decarboxylase family protein YurZ